MKYFIVFGLLVIALAGIVSWFFILPKKTEGPSQENEIPEEGVFCTMEAKLCPDGSYVGRVAPSCEFATCPTELASVIVVTSPLSGGRITSPLTITGEARGQWYFEASFPVVLTDWDGRIIAEGHAEAQRDWMTENFVPFKAVLTFTTPAYGDRGTLILQKDNPSGLPKNDAALEIPIRFR